MVSTDKRECSICKEVPLKHINLCVVCNDHRKAELILEKAAKWKLGDIDVATTRSGSVLSGWARDYLIAEAGNECSLCGWSECNPVLGRPILTIEHIDGDWSNNSYSNLKVLCYNCHTLTSTFGALNIGRVKSNRPGTSPTYRRITQGKQKPAKNECLEPGCNEIILATSTRCQRHAAFASNKSTIDWPEIDNLLDMLRNRSYSSVARELGVSDNAIRKRLRVRGYDPKTLYKLTD